MIMTVTRTKRKKKGAPGKSAPIKTKLLEAKYSILRMLQTPFLGAFWVIEKRLNRLDNELYPKGVRR